MPDNTQEPALAIMREVAESGAWAARLAQTAAARDDLPTPAAYYDSLGSLCARLDIWHTAYNHVMAGPEAVVGWVKGSALRPFLSPLAEALRRGFLAAYAAQIPRAYPPPCDGRVWRRFPRLFIMAMR